jgi:hypothetical protein
MAFSSRLDEKVSPPQNYVEYQDMPLNFMNDMRLETSIILGDCDRSDLLASNVNPEQFFDSRMNANVRNETSLSMF